jgi:hypothetical protein
LHPDDSRRPPSGRQRSAGAALSPAVGYLVPERRSGRDRRTLRRRRVSRGGLPPRRRGGRRVGEGPVLVDWHEPHLLFLSLAILLLSVTDAFLTLTLLTHGADEANPLLAFLLMGFPKVFAVVKMTLTGVGVIVLVALARAKIFRIIKVSAIMHWCVAAYVALIGYEWWLLHHIL